MRTFIITILVWAMLFGLLGTGVKVMATSPQDMTVQSTDVAADNNPSRVDMNHGARNAEMMPTR